MLFQIKCDCGHTGIVTGLPLLAHCSACQKKRLFRVNDGAPIIAKLMAADEEDLDNERRTWAEAFENAVAPWRQA